MRWLPLLVLLAPLSYAQKVTIEFDSAVDFGKYHTFLIRDGKLNSKNEALNNELVRKRLDADITAELTKRGLTKSLTNRADLNVRYTLGTVRKLETEAYPAGWRGWGTRVVRVPYAEGTLVIDLRDPTSRSLVWRGIAREEKNDPNKIEGKLEDMVHKSIEKYPPKPKE